MNGGAYGGETKDVLIEARGVDRARQCSYLYQCRYGLFLPALRRAGRFHFHAGAVSGHAGRSGGDRRRDGQDQEVTRSEQPIKSRTGGSTFKNPPGQKAWQLIDAAGCRGLTVGGAQVSDLHCNFLLNLGDATAQDIETLGETVRERVQAKSGIELEWEIKRIGVSALKATTGSPFCRIHLLDSQASLRLMRAAG